MKDTIANKITSFGNALAVVDLPEFEPVWSNKMPVAFGKKLPAVRQEVADLISAGAAQGVTPQGAVEALRNLRAEFEDSLLSLARATFRLLKELGRTEDAAKVDLTPTDLDHARAVALAGTGELILELAEPLTKPAAGAPAGTLAPATDHFDAATVAAVDDLWERYSLAVGAPAGIRARRKALSAELPDRVRTTEGHFAELDDLVLGFRGTELGKRFVEAWFNARRNVDLGRRSARKKVSPVVPAPGA